MITIEERKEGYSSSLRSTLTNLFKAFLTVGFYFYFLPALPSFFFMLFSVVAFSRVSEGERASPKKDVFVSLDLQSRALPDGGDGCGIEEAKGEVRSSERG